MIMLSSVLNVVAINNVFIREWLNGCLIPLNLSMMAIITYTVWRQTKFTWGWTKYPGANSACALWWIFFADLFRSVMAWAFLRESQINANVLDTYRTAPIATLMYMTAGIIATCAILRCIWCLTPARGRTYTWLGTLVFTVLFVGMAYVGLFDWLSDYIVYRVSNMNMNMNMNN